MPLFHRGLAYEKNIIQAWIQNPASKWKKYVRADWIMKRWNLLYTPEQDGPHTLIPWLCLSFDGGYKLLF